MADCTCVYVHGDNLLCPVHNDLCQLCAGPADLPWLRVHRELLGTAVRGRVALAYFADDEVGAWADFADEYDAPYEHYRCPEPFHDSSPTQNQRPGGTQ